MQGDVFHFKVSTPWLKLLQLKAFVEKKKERGERERVERRGEEERERKACSLTVPLRVKSFV